MVSTCARNSFWILQKWQIKKPTRSTNYIYLYSVLLFLLENKMTSNHMISSVILQCWCRFLFSSSLGTSERSHPQQQKPTHKAVGKIHEGMASNRSQLSQLSQWKLGNINGFQWIYDNCSIKPSKKKEPYDNYGFSPKWSYGMLWV